MPPPGGEVEQQKFEEDFIIFSEFSEQVGPVPIVSPSALGCCCQLVGDRTRVIEQALYGFLALLVTEIWCVCV